MYTSYIGIKFLKIYRERNNLPDDYTARQFFDEVLFPYFFDAEQFFMSVHSSPFDQLFAESGAKFKKHKKENPDIPFVPLYKIREHRVRKLEELHTKIEKREIGGNTAVGYYTRDNEGTTSGQITSIKEFVTSEDMYASWIGQGLAIRIDGGIILSEEEDVLWAIFNGWKQYRDFLKKTPNIKDKQVETWNGHWLSHTFGRRYNPKCPLKHFQLPELTNIQGKLGIPTIDWLEIIVALSRQFYEKPIVVYAYSLSKTNTTYGFLVLDLPKVKSLIQLKLELFPFSNDGFNDKGTDRLYSTFYNFKNACKLGAIGLKALEPQNLRAFMPVGTAPYAQGKDYKFSNPNIKVKKNETAEAFEIRQQKAKDKYNGEIINFQIFKTWIIAMLNNKKELNALAEQVAQALIDFENNKDVSKREQTKKIQSQLSKDVKSAKTLREFIENLTELMAKYKDNATIFKEVKDAVIVLPSDLFPLFITLIRFEYQYKKSI